MPRFRATLSRSAIDRDLHTHLGRAASAVRAAVDVCGRGARGQRRSEESPYRDKQKLLARAERLLSDIGHLEESPEASPDLRSEARALCSWLEGRERTAGVPRPSRRGQVYQARLQQVLRFLSGDEATSSPEETKSEPKVAPEPLESKLDSEGAMWERALELARQQGRANDDAYVMAIFVRLAGGSGSDG